MVSTTADDLQNNGNCTLREAVQAANLDQPVDACPAGSGEDIIQVPAGTYALTIPGTFENDNQTGDIDFQSSLNIEGSGKDQTIIRVERESVQDRIFQVVRSDIRVRIQGVTLRDGNLNTESEPGGDVEEPLGGAVYNTGILIVTDSAFINNSADAGASGEGGALYNYGSLEVNNSVFLENYAGSTAGAIHNDHILTVNNSRFENNFGYTTAGIATSVTSQTTINGSLFVANHIGLGTGAALNLAGPTTVRNTVFDDNIAEGGAITNFSRLVMIDSRLVNNTGGDGAVVNRGNLIVQGTSFENNSGLQSGGIFSIGEVGVRVENSTFTNNSSEQNGGAISMSAGNLEIHNATLQGNQAALRGGGLYIGETAQVFATLSTISGNVADGEGGGIFSMGQFNFQTTTISGNQAAQGGGIYILGGQQSSILYDTTLTANNPGGAVIRGGSLGFVRSILAGNLPARTPDCDTQNASEVYSQGHNLVGNGTGCNWTAAEGDIVGSAQEPVDPLLGPLGDNGGPTFTHELLEGSPAIDAAGTESCGPMDQRGQPRPSGPACDIGSYEKQLAAVTQYFISLPFIRR